MAKPAVAHDHIVMLLDTKEFENIPSWLTENFNVIEGGTHAGGSSRNKLIVFKDGTYLELFNWIKEPVEFLAWAHKSSGFIDYALTTVSPVTAEQNYDNVQTKLSQSPSIPNLGVTFEQPKSGGRRRSDGTEVKWQTTRPTFEKTETTLDDKYFPGGRLDVPFFCHDVTERNVRVQFDNEELTTHPCGAIGIEDVQVMVPGSHASAYLALYGAVLGTGQPLQAQDEEGDDFSYFEINVPHPTDSRLSKVVVYSSAPPPGTGAAASNEIDFGELFLTTRGAGAITRITLRKAESETRGKSIALAHNVILKA